MKKTYIFILLIISQVSIYSQNHRIYTPFKLQNYSALWQKVMIDSSIIGLINPFQQSDEPVYFDGFSHFNSYDIFKLDPVFYNGKIYLAELGQIFGDGAFIECIDELSGRTKWKTVYDHRTDVRKEYPVRIFINGEGQYQILGHREDFSRPSNFPGNFWSNSVFTTRKYDSSTGDLLDRDTSDETSPNTCKMAIPFGLHDIFNQLFSTYLINNSEKFKYISPRAFNFKLFDIDSKGLVLDSVIINRAFDATTYRDRTYFLSDDKILNFRFARNIHGTPEDSFHVYYTLYDIDFNVIKNKDLRDALIPAYDYKCVYSDDSKFIIMGKNYEAVGDTSIDVMTVNSFDINGELKESVRLENEDGSPIYSTYPNTVAIPINENGGMLISSNELDRDGYNNLVFFKTNGLGSFDKITKWRIEDKKHGVLPLYLWKTPKEKILVKLAHSNTDLEKLGYSSLAMVYLLIEPEDLGIKTSITDYYEMISLILSPNPTTDYFTISCEATGNKKVEILDQLGRLVLQHSIEECGDNQVDISTLNSGLYFVRLTDDEGRIVGTGKLVKE